MKVKAIDTEQRTATIKINIQEAELLFDLANREIKKIFSAATDADNLMMLYGISASMRQIKETQTQSKKMGGTRPKNRMPPN